MNRAGLILSCIFLVVGCAPTATPVPDLQVVNVYATSAAQPWLTDVYDCAPSAVAVNLSDPHTADIFLRIGEPESLTTPAYQIDSEEILVVTSRESPVQNMDLAQTRALFMGIDSQFVQILIYSSGEDVQQIFDRVVMQGDAITSQARLALTSQQMSDVLNTEKNAVGILSRHWKAGNPRQVFSLGSYPVLAIVNEEPQGAIGQLIACLQK